MLKALFSVLLITVLANISLAQDDLYPDSPAGRAAERWFDAVRSGEPDRLRDLIENHFDAGFRDRVGVEQHLARHTALSSAGINAPHSVARATDHDITLYLRDGGVWGELRISVNPEPPHGITNVGVRPSQGPPEAMARPESTELFQSETEEFLRGLFDAKEFEGSVIVQQQEEPVIFIQHFRIRPAQNRLSNTFLRDPLCHYAAAALQAHAWLAKNPNTPEIDQHALVNPFALGRSGHVDQLKSLQPDSRERMIKNKQREISTMVDHLFRGDSQVLADLHNGILHAIAIEHLGMRQTIFATETRSPMNQSTPQDIAVFGHAVLSSELLGNLTLTALTTGTGPDLDPSPAITRRTALGFEERIDHTPQGDIRSFSARAGDDSQHALLRCYPGADYVVVIVAQDDKTLDLIDRRIFNRLPGLEPTP